MYVMCPSAGRSTECCVTLAFDGGTAEQSACAPEHRVRATKKTATSGHRAWRSRRRAEVRTSPPDVICASRAHQTHVHSWGGQTGGLNEETAALYSLHSNCSSTRSLGTALKPVAKENTMRPTVYRRRSFPKTAGRSGECLGKAFKLFGESPSVQGSPIITLDGNIVSAGPCPGQEPHTPGGTKSVLRVGGERRKTAGPTPEKRPGAAYSKCVAG